MIAVAAVSAKPGVVLGAAAPLLSAPYVTATSSQVIARNYNGLAVVARPAAFAYAPAIVGSDAATFSSYTAYPHVVGAAAIVSGPHPYAAYRPNVLAAAAPLKYVAAPGAVLL